MKGWSAAAGFTGIPTELQNDEDFLAGWDDGKIARKIAHTTAELKYDIKWDVFKLI